MESTNRYADLLLDQGMLAASEGQTESAKDCFIRALRENPNHDLAWLWLASLSDSPQLRLIYLSKVIELSPQDAKAVAQLGVTKARFAEELVMRGRLAAKAGEVWQAAHCLLHALELNPSNEDAWLALAQLENPPEDRGMLLERALEINPSNGRAIALLDEVRGAMEEAARAKATPIGSPEAAAAEPLLESATLPDTLTEQALTAHVAPETVPVPTRLPSELDHVPLSSVSQDQREPEGTVTVPAELTQCHLDSGGRHSELEFPELDLRAEFQVPEVPAEALQHNPAESSHIWVGEPIAAMPLASTEDVAPEEARVSDSLQTPQSSLESAGDESSTNGPFAHFEQIETEDLHAVPVEVHAELAETIQACDPWGAFVAPDSANAPQLEDVQESPAASPKSAESAPNGVEGQSLAPLDQWADPWASAEDSSWHDSRPAASFSAPVAEPESPPTTLKLSLRTMRDLDRCPLCDGELPLDVGRCPSCGGFLRPGAFLDPSIESELAKLDRRQILLAAARHSRLLSHNAEDAATQYKLGIAYLNLKHSHAALRCLRQACELEPNAVLAEELKQLSRAQNPPAAAPPVVEARPQAPVRKFEPEGFDIGGRQCVLIVDDSPTIRKLVTTTLEKYGYRVISAVDGAEGLAKARASKPDLVFLDVMMPKLDGFQVCKSIREKTKDLPVIILSGKDSFFDKMRGKMVGSTAYITKPFDPRTLVETVRRHCRTA